MLTGTITFTHPEYSVDQARAILEKMGVKVGRWCISNFEFTHCEVDDAAMNRLDPYWGTFIWCLTPKGK